VKSFELGPILRSITRQKSTFALVVLELASGFTVISCLLLAGLWYLYLGNRTSGHAEQDILAVTLQLPAATPADVDARQAAELGRIRAVPGVVAAAPVSTSLVDERWGYPSDFHAVGSAASAVGWTLRTTPALFDVLRLEAAEGRPLGDLRGGGDVDGVVVLTRCLRDRLFPGGAPALGRVVASEDAGPARVVGVIGDVTMRIPFLPSSRCVALRFSGAPDERESRYLVRTAPGRRHDLVAPITAALGGSAPARYLSVIPFDSRAAKHHAIASGLVTIMTIFGATVAFLALLGVLAVSSYVVTERTRQIGIRRALGGTRGDIVRYFLVESSLATLFGTGLGLISTLALFVFMKRVFTELRFDGRYLALTAFCLWIIATVAAMIPARRAARIPPSVATKAS